MHELELENDRGVVETSFLFLIGCFYKKNVLLTIDYFIFWALFLTSSIGMAIAHTISKMEELTLL